jgi:hypothetical protein
MLLLAVTTLDKLKQIPPAFWLKVGVAILAVIVAVLVLRYLLSMNKFIVGGAIILGGALLFANWVYERTEPAFLTPLVDHLAPFFPSKGAYDNKQSRPPGR